MNIKLHTLAFFLTIWMAFSYSGMALAEELPPEDEALQEESTDSIGIDEGIFDESIEEIPQDAEEESNELLEDIIQDDTDFADTVFNEAELSQWIDEHNYVGGTVTLGAVITITDYIHVLAYESAPITINTGNFGLVYNGALIYGSLNNLHIIGEGVYVPVIDAISAPEYETYLSSWNHDLMQMNITANGRDGLGGTALRIRAEDENSINAAKLCQQGMIRSYGEGAVGLWLDVPMGAYGYRVEVYGDNSVGIYAPNGSELYYCKLTADGVGASAVSGSGVLADTCAIFPEPQGVKVINRKIDTDFLSQFYIPLKQYSVPDSSLLNEFYMSSFFLTGDNGGNGEVRYFCVNWNMDAYMNIDTGIMGETQITADVDDVFMGLGLFDDVNIIMNVDVRDPELPCISSVNIREKYDNVKLHAYLHFWDSYDVLDENVILWRSDDEGETWRKAKTSPDIEWHGDWLDYSYTELLNPVWFQLEIVGVGESNIVILSEKNGVSYSGLGGDRTGTDRGGAETDNSEETTETEDTNQNTGEQEDSLLNGNGNAGDTQSQYTNDSYQEINERQYTANERSVAIISDDTYAEDSKDTGLLIDVVEASKIESYIINTIDNIENDYTEPSYEDQLIENSQPEHYMFADNSDTDELLPDDEPIIDSYASTLPDEPLADVLPESDEQLTDNDALLQSMNGADGQSETSFDTDRQSGTSLTNKAQSSAAGVDSADGSNQTAPAPIDTDTAIIALLCSAVALIVLLLVLRLHKSGDKHG